MQPTETPPPVTRPWPAAFGIMTFLFAVGLLVVLGSGGSSVPSGSAPSPLPFSTVGSVRTPFAGLSRLGLQDYSGSNNNPAVYLYKTPEVEQLKQLRQSGVDVIRFGTNLWAYVPATEVAGLKGDTTAIPVYLTPDASRVALLSSLGFTVVIELGTGDEDRYAMSEPNQYPVHPHNQTSYAHAVSTAVSIFSACPYNVHYFELGNEVDQEWKLSGAQPTETDPVTSAQSYVEALHTFHDIVKSADPNNVVINGGLAHENANYGTERDWLNHALQAGLGKYIDVLAFHYYPRQYYGSLNDTITSQAQAIGTVLAAPQPGYTPVNTTLWCNETGLTSEEADFFTYGTATVAPGSSPTVVFPSRTPQTDLTVQAGQVVRMNVGGAAANLAGQVWYERRDFLGPGSALTAVAQHTPYPVGDSFTHSGLIDGARTPKPAFTTMRVLGQQHLDTAALVHPPGYPDGVFNNNTLEGYTFRSPASRHFLSVVWDANVTHTGRDGGHASYPLNPTQVANLGAVVNMFGTPVTVVPTPNGVTPLTLNIDPLYLQWQTSFSDVNVGDTFYSFIDLLAQRGVVAGYNDYTFGPSNPTTRAQACKIIVLAAGWTLVNPQTASFSDVPIGTTFYQFVETAVNHGIVSGYSDGTFRPNNAVSRQQLSKILVLAAGWSQVNPTPTPTTPTFTDVPSDNLFYPFIETLYSHGVVSGYTCGGVNPQTGMAEPCDTANRPYFRPANYSTRGQVSKMTQLTFMLQTPTPIPTPTLIMSSPTCGIVAVPTAQPRLPAPAPTGVPNSLDGATPTLPEPVPSQPPPLP